MEFPQIKFDEKGLVPAVVQDIKDGAVLMVAYMNNESLGLTLTTGFATFYSRSRNKLWKKGEESGNVLRVKEVYYDCDGDCILVKAEPAGPTCHTGNRTCFYRRLET
ncbi:MAG: phosphoribosyl-AMP cyclohydrolase [Proteobacteria bacterium]|nr:phosphoribosyl-AMP cyclohydrolase [Pseudomonadota bacterium]